MSKIFFIGDVHGCLQELIILLDNLKLSDKDHIVFLGDLVNKGPDSLGVLNLVLKLKNTHTVTIIKGNHEDKLLKLYKKIKNKEDLSEAINKKKHLLDLALSLEDKHIDMLSDAYLWLQHKNFLAVHGGIPPCIHTLLTKEQYEACSKKEKKFFDQLMRVRYVNKEGQMVRLNTETTDDIFWSEVYDGRFGMVFYGHQAYKTSSSPERHPFSLGIDLGCVYGGYLCCAEVNDADEIKFHKVKAAKAYCE